MPARQRSVHHEFPPGNNRPQLVEHWLTSTLQQWDLHPWLSRRWLTAATTVLEQPEALVAFAQHDPALHLFTLELWHDGRTIYGIDDWIG